MRNGFIGSLIVLAATTRLASSGETAVPARAPFNPFRAALQSRAPLPSRTASLASSPSLAAGAPSSAPSPSVSQSVPQSVPPSVGAEAPDNLEALSLGAAVPNDSQAFQQSAGSAGGRYWGGAEFLLWWIKNGNAPPLVTTGPPAAGGVLGAPGTTTLFGGALDYGALPGGRFTLGAWLNPEATRGIELSYFFLNGGAVRFSDSSSGAAGSAVLSRPFFNVLTGEQDREVVAFPGLAAGGVQVSSNSALQGAALNFFCNLCCGSTCTCRYRVDLFAGPAWFQFNEDLAVAEQVTDATATFSIVDRFETRNNFYGGQIGARAEWQHGLWFANLRGLVALGDTNQQVLISGTTVITVPGAAPNVQQGGLLALPTNIGNYNRDSFAVVPMIGVNAGCQLTNNLRAFAGYNFLYWSNVARPGDQIDLGINPSQIPSTAGPGPLVGPARPAFEFRDTDFWAHGISVGMEFRW